MVKKVLIHSDLCEARGVEETLMQVVADYGYDESEAFAIKLALEEGLNNAIRHGNGCDRCKTVEICCAISDSEVTITIRDEGPGFNPDTLPDPTTAENLEKPNGRGVMLMRAYMDEVSFNNSGNQVCMIKRRCSKAV